jgi:hypothetical protein
MNFTTFKRDGRLVLQFQFGDITLTIEILELEAGPKRCTQAPPSKTQYHGIINRQNCKIPLWFACQSLTSCENIQYGHKSANRGRATSLCAVRRRNAEDSIRLARHSSREDRKEAG